MIKIICLGKIKEQYLKDAIKEYEKALKIASKKDPKSAAIYSNIGINRIEQLLRNPQCPFVLYVGNKKLVKRKKFEEFLEQCDFLE